MAHPRSLMACSSDKLARSLNRRRAGPNSQTSHVGESACRKLTLGMSLVLGSVRCHLKMSVSLYRRATGLAAWEFARVSIGQCSERTPMNILSCVDEIPCSFDRRLSKGSCGCDSTHAVTWLKG